MSTDSPVPNVLAERYASRAMKSVWSPEGKARLERDLWIAVMKAQRELGLDIPAEAIAAYERVKDSIDLPSISRRERVTRHDVKARLDEFSELAGHQHAHKGMTSRDLTENVEQLQIYRSLLIIRDRCVAALARLGRRAEEFASLSITARTHNVAAQLTTMGKRFAMWGEGLLHVFARLENALAFYPVRGLKGAVGTQLDIISLFDGDKAKAADLEKRVLAHLGLPVAWDSVGQVYPRGLDFHVVGLLFETATPASDFARTLRLMAGHELAGEGFAPGQTGSSAMPHKMNSRSCERINGFHSLLTGHVAMASSIAGDQWNEGDVSCSVVRRVMLPDAFFATDGLFETFLTVLDQMEVHPDVILSERNRYLPFLLTTTVLMAAVKAGAGREEAHEAVKEHAVAALRELRKGGENQLWDKLAADPRLRLSRQDLAEIRDNGASKIGAAPDQAMRFAQKVSDLASRHPEAAAYTPGVIL